jgi:hypothetical protein
MYGVAIRELYKGFFSDGNADSMRKGFIEHPFARKGTN